MPGWPRAAPAIAPPVPPPGAQTVARSPAGPAAFTLDRSLGLQFHPESTPEIAAEWARQDAAVMNRLIEVDNRRMSYMRALFADFSRDAAEAEERSLLAFCVWIGQPLIAAEHGGRNRRDVVRAALEIVLS